MKKLSIFTLLLMLTTTILSCNHEEIIYTEESQLTAKPFTRNYQNHFEEYGILSYDLFELYMNSKYNSNTLDDIAKDVSELLTYHSTLNAASIHLNDGFESQINAIKINPIETLEWIIQENNISSIAEVKISEIIELLTQETTMTTNDLYRNLVNIENTVIVDQNIPNHDKNIILLSSCLLRYSLFDNGHDDDKDWDLSVGNFIFSFYGATISIQDALLINLSTRILEYQ